MDSTIAHVVEEIGVGAPLLADEREELKGLRRRVYDLERDNEFLGKAAAFFASKPPPRNGSS